MAPRLTLVATAALLLLHCGVRAWGLFGPISLRPLILASFLLLWPTPWLLMSRRERNEVGFGRPRRFAWWGVAALAGAAVAGVCFGLAYFLYSSSPENPFVSVRASYLSGRVPAVGPLGLFCIFTGPGMVFSPFGEEVFCRGVVYQRTKQLWGDAIGVVSSATVFASVHLLHHGLTFHDGTLGFRGPSGLVWFAMMFGTSLTFTAMRRAGGTLWLAVVSHAFYNLAMNASIFAVLTPAS